MPQLSQMIEQILPILNYYTESADVEILTKTVRQLVNMIEVTNEQNMQLIANDEIVKKLTDFIKNTYVPLKINALSAFIEIASKSTEQRKTFIEYNLLEAFLVLSKNLDPYIQNRFMDYLCKILAFEEISTKSIIDAQLLPNIKENLRSEELQMKTFSARAICSLLSRSSANCLIQIIQADIITALCETIGEASDTPELNKVRAYNLDN